MISTNLWLNLAIIVQQPMGAGIDLKWDIIQQEINEIKSEHGVFPRFTFHCCV
jgi:hypothetical protein